MRRRTFFPALAGLSVPHLLAAQRSVGRAKITDIRSVTLKVVRDVGSLEPAWDPGGRMGFRIGGDSITQIRTDSGLTGIGPQLPGAMLAAVQRQLIGKDPFDVETHTLRLRQFCPGLPYANSAGAEIALWDLIGKACGQPLYKLWGGGKERVLAYASMIQLSTPEERASLAQQLLSEGWKAIKLRLHYQTMAEDIRLLEMVRRAVGDKMEIMADANQSQGSHDWQPGVVWGFQRAFQTAQEMQRLGCRWLEEPLPRFSWDRLAELNRLVEIPLAGGEHIRTVHDFMSMLRQDVYDIYQPECMVVEGITTMRKVGVITEAFERQIVPHHGQGPVGIMAHLHLIASWNHAPYVEILHDPPIAGYRDRLAVFDNPPSVDKEGMVAMPQDPGLGVTIRSDLIS